MASRIMHLAVTECLLKQVTVKDKKRLQLGALLPDAPYHLAAVNDSHFRTDVCNGIRKTYDLTKFRQLFMEEILSDDLYLGYYLHLIQDMMYRQFAYKEQGWDASVPGFVEQLYHDYTLLNGYVIHQYQLTETITVPEDFEKQRIQSMYRFDLKTFLENLKSDFTPCVGGEYFFFTPELADGYIKKAAEVCMREVKALQEGSLLFNELEYTWEKRTVQKAEM